MSSESNTKKRRLEVASGEGHSDAPQPSPEEEVTVLSHAERRRQKKKQKQSDELGTKPASGDAAPRKKCKLDDSTSTPTADEQVDTHAATKSKPPSKSKSKSKPKPKSKTTPTTDDARRQHHRQNSIWIGNLSFRTTQDALRAFFDGVGTITRVHMPMRRGGATPGDNMGFAYVDFETPDAKVVAITLSEGQLDGRRLLIKDGDDFTGRPAKATTEPSFEGDDGAGAGGGEGGGGRAEGKSLSKTAQRILRTQKQPPAPTLFLGNLGFETTEASIRELFEAHRYKGKEKGKDVGQDVDGEKKDVWIRKIRMGTFEDSGNCKGFAFVDFTSIEHATEALVNPRNHHLNGRDLVVEYASPDAVRRGGGPRHPKGDQGQKSKTEDGKAPRRGAAFTPHTKQPGHRQPEQEEEDVDMPPETDPAPSRRPDRAGHNRSHTRRARPGAALADAPRQSAAILPSQGQKIVF